MGASVGTEGKGSVNVELNIVPFIDLMSCLTAFLLVTAVWVNISQLDIKPAGRNRDVGPTCGDDCPPKLSVLVEKDSIWIGVSRVNDFEEIPNTASGHDWARLEERLKAQRSNDLLKGDTSIEIAAESTQSQPVAYQQLVATMDIAVKVGFKDVGLADPHSLSARPHM